MLKYQQTSLSEVVVEITMLDFDEVEFKTSQQSVRKREVYKTHEKFITNRRST